MPPIELLRASVDGVPAFVADRGTGIPVVGLVFRVGRADETAATGGLSHLVEHLALPATTNATVDFNGTVDAIVTSFFASGESDDLRRFVSETAALLRDPPEERFDVERRILLAEEATRSGGGARQALALRFGPNGAGLIGYDEYGLRRLTWTDVCDWATTRFTMQNAALWLAGADLDAVVPELGLPSGGAPVPPPHPRPLADLETPAVYASGVEVGMCLSLLGPRTIANRLTIEVVADALRQRLRYELGHSYSIEHDLQAISNDVSHACLTADVTDEHVEAWMTEAAAIVDRIASDGPEEAVLDRIKAAYRRYDRDVSAAAGWAAVCADWQVTGHPYLSDDDYLAEREAVTPETIAETLSTIRSSLLVLGPESTPVLDGFNEYPMFSTVTRIEGRRHRPSSRRDRRQLRDVELQTSEEGITSAGFGNAITARFDSTVVCLHEPGERTLLTDDGFYLNIAADSWTDGDDVLAVIDAGVPQHLVVPDRHGLEARRQMVDALAASTFKRTWLVSTELGVLPGQLAVGETLLVLAKASRGWRLGLLALTDSRLLFVYEEGEKHSFVFDRDELQASAGDSKLELVANGDEITLTEVEPKGKAQEFEQLLRGGAVETA